MGFLDGVLWISGDGDIRGALAKHHDPCALVGQYSLVDRLRRPQTGRFGLEKRLGLAAAHPWVSLTNLRPVARSPHRLASLFWPWGHLPNLDPLALGPRSRRWLPRPAVLSQTSAFKSITPSRMEVKPQPPASRPSVAKSGKSCAPPPPPRSMRPIHNLLSLPLPKSRNPVAAGIRGSKISLIWSDGVGHIVVVTSAPEHCLTSVTTIIARSRPFRRKTVLRRPDL